MTSSIAGTSSISLIAGMMQQQNTAQNIDIAVLQKGLDIQKTQGEAVLQLINISGNPAHSGAVDIYV